MALRALPLALLLALVEAAAPGFPMMQIDAETIGAEGAAVQSKGSRTTPAAYFLLTFDMLRAPDWPAAYANYSLFITSPTFFSSDLVAKVHQDVPGSKVLAYFDSVSVPLKIGCSTGSPMGNLPIQRRLPDDPDGYYKQLRAGFNTSWLLRSADGKLEPLCPFPGLAGYVLMQESADYLAKFHRDVTMARGFDGVYLDMLTDDYWVAPQPPWGPSNLNVTQFDCDGDGRTNTVKDVQSQWKGWRPYFVQRMREAIGPDAILIGNSAGAMSLPQLNGVTIEMEWCGADMAACLAAIESSRAVSAHRPVDVFWLTQAQQVPPPVQCKLVYEMASRFDDGSVYAGSDWYDGSRIVC